MNQPVSRASTIQLPTSIPASTSPCLCRWVALRAPYIAHLSYTGCAVLGPALEGELFRLSRLAQRLHSVQLQDVVHSADHLLGQLLQCPVLQEVGK